MDVGTWLQQLGLQEYAEAFAKNDIDAQTLVALTGEDLKEIGVDSVGHRRRLLNAIALLAAEAAAVVDEASDSGPEAERRQLTVMFCDLVGSTALAEAFDPEQMRLVIRSYQESVAEAIAQFDGNVAKFMGDGVLAYFGWPYAHEDDAERAVRSGLAIAEAIGRQAAPDGRELRVRVGIATGLVVVGDLIGEGAAREAAVVGATPNLAARLQGLATANSVVISDATHVLIGGRFSCEVLAPQRLRGFAEPVTAWRVMEPIEAESRFAATRGPHLTPLVGRAEELELLGRRWETARASAGQVVLLAGEAGIGKSRIAHSFRRRIAGDPHVRLLYQCSPYHTNSALHPFIRQLERAARFARGDSEARRLDKLEALLRGAANSPPKAAVLIAALLSLPVDDRYPPLSMSPQKHMKETIGVLLEQLAELTARQPVLLVFEDVHWLDPTSRELLDQIVARIEHLPVLALITFRPDFAPPWAGKAHVTLLMLNRLTHQSGAAMVRALTGGKAMPQEVLDELVERTDGIPLFVEELTRTVVDSGLLRETKDRYEVCGHLPAHAIPATLKDSLMARLDQHATAKEVAQTAAVIGREFSYGLLVEVAGLPDEELTAGLERLVGTELVFCRGAPPDAQYIFKHALVQDAAYESLLKARRQQLHARIAEVLEARFPERVEMEPELLAHHFTEARLAEQAVTYWHRAGERAVAQSAHLEAIGHLRKGLQLLDKLSDGPRRAQCELMLRIALGPALIATQGYGAPEVYDEYSRARELCHNVGDTAQLCPVLYGLWTFHSTRAEHETGRTLGRRLLHSAEIAQEPSFLMDAHVAVSCSSFFTGEFVLANDHGERCLELFDPHRHRTHTLQVPGVTSGIINAAALWYLGYPDQARARGEEALNLARELSHPFSLSVALTWLAMLHLCRRDGQEARTVAEEAMEICAEYGLQFWLWVATMVRGWALIEEGLLEEGTNQLREAATRMEGTGAKIWGPYRQYLLAKACERSGKLGHALRGLDEAIKLANDTGERYWDAELHRLRAGLLLQGPEPNPIQAEASFLQALESARAQQAKSLELRAATSLSRLWLHQDRRSEARDLLSPLYDWFTEGFNTADLRDAKSLLDELS